MKKISVILKNIPLFLGAGAGADFEICVKMEPVPKNNKGPASATLCLAKSNGIQEIDTNRIAKA